MNDTDLCLYIPIISSALQRVPDSAFVYSTVTEEVENILLGDGGIPQVLEAGQ